MWFYIFIIAIATIVVGVVIGTMNRDYQKLVNQYNEAGTEDRTPLKYLYKSKVSFQILIIVAYMVFLTYYINQLLAL